MKIKEVFELQKNNCSKISQSPAEERITKLNILHNVILKREEEIEEAINEDFKKHFLETRLTEIFTVTHELKHVKRNLKNWLKPKKVNKPLFMLGTKNKIIFEPKGTALIISPWNYPFNLSISPVISAVAAGNSFILKPSEKSANTSEILKSIISEVFNPEEGFVFTGGADVAGELLSLPFDHIFYTGGKQVAKIVMKNAADNLASVTLELGGKSPVIICKDADLDKAVRRTIWAKFFNCGQTCIAPDYILIDKVIENEFISKAKLFVNQLYGDLNKITGNIDYCRIIDAGHFRRIKSLIGQAIQNGAENILGDNYLFENENFIPPVILRNITSDMDIMKEEIFGPVLPIIPFDAIEEVNNIIAKNPKPLALYLFTKNDRRAEIILKNNPSGGAVLKDVLINFANSNLPFGGVNSSGIGKTHGYYGFLEFSNMRPFVENKWFFAQKYFYPPYNSFKERLINILVKYF